MRRPSKRAEDPDLPAAVLGAYLDIATTPGPIGAGDVLVFLPGEREIRDVAELLERELERVEVLPLFSRLSWEQQSKIFKRGPRSKDRARDQCRGNLHHGTGHSRGHRLRTRAHQPLQSAQPLAAAAHRAGVARERGTAQGPLRSHRGRAVRATVFPGGVRGAARVHRAGGAAHESRGAPAAPGRGRPGRGGDISLHRSARVARPHRRLSRAAGARGARCGAVHHQPRAGDGAAAIGSAARARAPREPALSRRKRAACARRGIERAGCAHVGEQGRDRR